MTISFEVCLFNSDFNSFGLLYLQLNIYPCLSNGQKVINVLTCASRM